MCLPWAHARNSAGEARLWRATKVRSGKTGRPVPPPPPVATTPGWLTPQLKDSMSISSLCLTSVLSPLMPSILRNRASVTLGSLSEPGRAPRRDLAAEHGVGDREGVVVVHIDPARSGQRADRGATQIGGPERVDRDCQPGRLVRRRRRGAVRSAVDGEPTSGQPQRIDDLEHDAPWCEVAAGAQR